MSIKRIDSGAGAIPDKTILHSAALPCDREHPAAEVFEYRPLKSEAGRTCLGARWYGARARLHRSV